MVRWNTGQWRRPGFTLIELLVVIAIISLLVSILLPSLRQAKWLARVAACGATQRSLGLAIHMYAGEYDGYLPPENSQWSLHMPAIGQIPDCLPSVLIPDFAQKGAFFDPGFEYHNPSPNPYPEKHNTPDENFPDAGGNWWMGYTWHGGYNVGYGWWWQHGHRAITLDTHLPAGVPGATSAQECIPAEVSPLVDMGWGDGVNWAASHWQDGDPADDAGVLPGHNEWYLDSHVDWVEGEDLFKGTIGGPYYFWQSDMRGY